MRRLFDMDMHDHEACTRTHRRDSARSIIIRDGRVAMVRSLKYDYYKFPGGGIEAGEDPVAAMIRETREEAGLTVIPEAVREYGCVYRAVRSLDDPSERFVQYNYYYLCDAEDDPAPQQLDGYEAEEHYSLEFIDPVTAIRKNRSVTPDAPYSPSMFEREARVLESLIAEGLLSGNPCDSDSIPAPDHDLRRISDMMLIEPTTEYADGIRAYRQAFLDSGDSMDGTNKLRQMEDPAAWVAHCLACKDPETAPDGLVPATQYIFVRKEDRKIVGMIQIRHVFNDYLEKFGGHIGYSVAPGERRKGYASEMLRLTLPKCRELGIDRVLITCIRGNEGSRKTILKNGGVFESAVFEPEMKEYLERWWIDLEN